MKRLMTGSILIALAGAALLAQPAAASGRHHDPLRKVDHFVVIYEENHSFDNLYGGWERVNGLRDADRAHTRQVNQAGAPYSCLLQTDISLQTSVQTYPAMTATNVRPGLLRRVRNAYLRSRIDGKVRGWGAPRISGRTPAHRARFGAVRQLPSLTLRSLVSTRPAWRRWDRCATPVAPAGSSTIPRSAATPRRLPQT